MSASNNHRRTLILLDVDGVLVHPAGYKEALRATVNRFARQMGLGDIGPSDDAIAVFEACGVTNEWDSGAICVSALLQAALTQRPDLRRETLDATLDAIRAAAVPIETPDFRALAQAVAAANGVDPALHYWREVAARWDESTLPLLSALLNNVYDVPNTPTTRAFQTHALGSDRFTQTYGVPAPFESESYLAAHDIPLLDPSHADRLAAWHRDPRGGVAVFTARPSLPPADLPDEYLPVDPSYGYPPEAELAAEMLGIAGRLPMIAQGRIGWIAHRHGRTYTDYVKPSPVQGVAAIAAAATNTETDALLAAATLAEDRTLAPLLADLRGARLRVVVLDDSTGGIRAVRGAVEWLRAEGLDLTFEGIGVSPHPDKRAALRESAEHVVDDVNAGLELVWG